ncbi:MAG TPA: hypothetical protein VFA27_07150 [Vicinamibacterales bacterium]|nr:hypothetical protein [Vicinamibacterales bacterium]
MRRRSVASPLVAVALNFALLHVATTWIERSTQAPPQATLAAAPFWFSPLIDLVKFFFDKGNAKVDDKAQPKLAGAQSSAKGDAQTLKPLPDFLVSERDLRGIATNLAQLATLMATYPTVAENEWPSMVETVNEAKTAFAASYDNSVAQPFLQSPAGTELLNARNACSTALSHIQAAIPRGNKGNTEAKQKLVEVLGPDFSGLATCSQAPDAVVVTQVRSFLGAYETVSDQSQKAPQKSASVGHIGNDLAHVTGPRLVRVAQRESTQGSRDNTDQLELDLSRLRAKLSEQAEISAKPPAWMDDLARRRQEGQTQALLTPIGAGLGGLSLAAAVVRVFPEFLLQIGLLDRRRLQKIFAVVEKKARELK